MGLIQLNQLCHVLLITTLLYLPERTTANCDDWRLKGRDDVCCRRCSPGNRLVDECGQDRTKLCTPCEPGTYTDHPLPLFCKRCTQCIDPQIQLKACSASADTVCGCKDGFLCGNKECSHCIQKCTKGEEPTDQRTCRKCPAGTFNDKIHSSCKPWTKSCPDGEHMIARGDEFSDIKCSKIPETTTPTPKEITTLKTTVKPKADIGSTKLSRTGVSNLSRMGRWKQVESCVSCLIGTKTCTHTGPFWTDNLLYLLLGCFGGSSALTFVLILSLWLAYKRTKNKRKSKNLKPGELKIMIVDREEACSFHQPEQEQGGSSESINTQDSETKLIV